MIQEHSQESQSIKKKGNHDCFLDEDRMRRQIKSQARRKRKRKRKGKLRIDSE
jgi:hypothetical protein